MRAVLRNVTKKCQKEIAYKLHEALEDQQKMQDLSLELEHRGYPKAANTVERFKLDLLNYRASPKDHWKKIRTTNGLERINKELKRRTRVVGAFPNDESFMRLAVSILMDINEEWLTGRKYLTMDVK